MPGADGWSVEDITVRSVLTHHSGIPGDIMQGMFAMKPHQPAEFPALLERTRAAAPAGLVHALTRQALELALVAKAGIEQGPEPEPPAEADTFTEAELDALAGHYETMLGFTRPRRVEGED